MGRGSRDWRKEIRDRSLQGESGGILYSGRRSLARRYLAQLPQGRKAARVSELFRVRGGPPHVWSPRPGYRSRRPRRSINPMASYGARTFASLSQYT